MKKLRRKIISSILTAGGILLVLLLTAAGAAVWKWNRTAGSNAEAEVFSRPELPESITLGQRFLFTEEYKVPWGTRPNEFIMDKMPEGLQLTAQPYFETMKYRWGYTVQKVVMPLQAYLDGTVKECDYTVKFSRKGMISKVFQHKIPAFTVNAADTANGELQIAGPVEELKRHPWFRHALLAVIVLVILVAAFLFFRRKKTEQEKIIPPWESAFLAITELLSRVRAGTTRPEQSVTELSNIVRSYIENRFRIRAEHQTTPEFLHELERSGSILNDSQQTFLRKFVEASDLIKFARLPAELNQVEDAAKKAQSLINETKPVQENGKSKDKEKGNTVK